MFWHVNSLPALNVLALCIYMCCAYVELTCSIKQWLYACIASTGVQPCKGKGYRAQANEISLVTGRLAFM